MSVKCPKCNSDNTDTAEFCSECATPLPAHGEVSVTKTLETPVKKLTKGTTFADRYEVLEELCKGGMGKIYKALDEEINEEVAIKIFKPKLLKMSKLLNNFRQTQS